MCLIYYIIGREESGEPRCLPQPSWHTGGWVLIAWYIRRKGVITKKKKKKKEKKKRKEKKKKKESDLNGVARMLPIKQYYF